ncbi:uncharacterized protein LOC122878792 [Siniperca chuatsi]|uniref:uncharacterized protein LOC122878792 n=1 Tax=Siniperca chuatsi TaxID=119488 RepID=UPI001CE0C0A6|nr:uncharacterized protein LOC122878792 [Siniperca chuatsi]
MQNQNADQKPVIPKVRYHPTIQTQTTGDGARAKTRTGETQKSRPAAVGPPQTGTGDRAVREAPQLNPAPAVSPRPGGGQNQRAQKPVKKPNQKPVQRAATDPDPPQTPNQLSNRAPPRPEQVPPGLGVRLDRYLVEEVEVLTRGQSTNQDWFTWRKNRITASVAHRIAHCRFVNGKSKTPPTSYLSAITGEGRNIQTRAMSWGVQKEAEVVRRYQTLKSAAMGRSVSVQDCGLFIDARRPWLAASPDGIVTDSRTGQRLLCLEVKCPYKHRHRRVEDACRDDRAFCLEIQDQDRQEPGGSPVYRLKTSHSYFTQIQCQLAVTGLRQADLAVFTLKETAIVPVTFDPNLWEETVSKLEVFYRDAVLPHLREKTQQDTAAWTPEL